MPVVREARRVGGMGFDDLPLDLRLVDEDSRTYELRVARTWTGRDGTFTVPAGFRTNFASVPQLVENIIPRTGRISLPSLFHDWLYTAKLTKRRHADGIFRRMMRERGIGVVKRWLVYLILRVFGFAAWYGWSVSGLLRRLRWEPKR